MTRMQKSWVGLLRPAERDYGGQGTPMPRRPDVARVSRPVMVSLLCGQLRRSLVAGILALVLTAVSRADPAADEGWQDLAGYLFRDAHDAFTRTPVAADRMRAL